VPDIAPTDPACKSKNKQGTLALPFTGKSRADTAITAGEWTGAAAIFTDEIFAIRARIRQERNARNLSRGQEDVGEALCALIAAGDDTPSWADLARLARCHVRTVARAVRKLRLLDLLESRRRGELRAGRWRRIASKYVLTMPAGPVLPRSCQKGTGSKQTKEKVAQETRCSGAESDEDIAAMENARRQIEMLLNDARRRRGIGA